MYVQGFLKYIPACKICSYQLYQGEVSLPRIQLLLTGFGFLMFLRSHILQLRCAQKPGRRPLVHYYGRILDTPSSIHRYLPSTSYTNDIPDGGLHPGWVASKNVPSETLSGKLAKFSHHFSLHRNPQEKHLTLSSSALQTT